MGAISWDLHHNWQRNESYNPYFFSNCEIQRPNTSAMHAKLQDYAKRKRNRDEFLFFLERKIKFL